MQNHLHPRCLEPCPLTDQVEAICPAVSFLRMRLEEDVIVQGLSVQPTSAQPRTAWNGEHGVQASHTLTPKDDPPVCHISHRVHAIGDTRV